MQCHKCQAVKLVEERGDNVKLKINGYSGNLASLPYAVGASVLMFWYTHPSFIHLRYTQALGELKRTVPR